MTFLKPIFTAAPLSVPSVIPGGSESTGLLPTNRRDQIYARLQETVPYVDQDAWNQGMLRLLERPSQILSIHKILPGGESCRGEVVLDQNIFARIGGALGYNSIDYLGRIDYDPTLTIGEIAARAFEMTLMLAVTGPDFNAGSYEDLPSATRLFTGGAIGGFQIDPVTIREPLNRHFVIQKTDSPSAVLLGEATQGAAETRMSGDEVTAKGGLMTLEHVLREDNYPAHGIRGIKFSVQGFGSVSQYMRQLVTNNGGQMIPPDSDTDVLILADSSRKLTTQDAEAVCSKYIVEMGSNKVEEEAYQVLERRGVRLIPSALTSAGGLIFFGYQSLRDRHRKQNHAVPNWEDSLALGYLRFQIDHAVRRVCWMSKIKKISLRRATDAYALERLSKAYGVIFEGKSINYDCPSTPCY